MTDETVNTGTGESATQRQSMYPEPRQSRSNANAPDADNHEDYITQGTNLPEIHAVNIQNIRELARNDNNVDQWCSRVQFALVGLSLEGLINNQLPRPTDQDIEYKRWKHWTRLVASWLYGQVDEEIQMIIYQNPKCATEADDLYQQILHEVRGTGKTLNAIGEIKKWDHMKRSDFTSAADFIRAYEKQYNVMKRFKLEVSPLITLVKAMCQVVNEVEKVKFITEQIGQMPPNSLTDQQLHDYLHDLATNAELSLFEGPASAARNDHRKKGKSNGKGRAKGKGQNDKQGESTNDSSSKPKVKPRNSPPDGKDIRDWAREKREGKQKDDDGYCTYCCYGPHNARDCGYISEKPPARWHRSPNLWCLSEALKEGKASMAIAMSTSSRKNDWLLDTGSNMTLTHDLDDFYSYKDDDPAAAYAYRDYSGNRSITKGHGEILIKAKMANGEVEAFLINGYYSPGANGKLIGMIQLLQDLDIEYNMRTQTLINSKGDVVGYTDTSDGVPYLITPSKATDLAACAVQQLDTTEDSTDDLGSDSDSEDDDTGFANKAVTAFEIHRRLGHAGKAKQAATLKHAVILGEDEERSTKHFDCEACFLGKSQQRISRDPQARVTQAGWKFHVDTQSMSPPGPKGEKYWMPVVDDATRLTEAPTFQSKDQIFQWLVDFCERIKLITGSYPGVWRMDNGSEFKRFIEWGKKRGMVFEPTPPYTKEPNGVSERYGGYLNSIQRTLIIDAGVPDKLWPYALDTAVYTTNRLVKPETGCSPLTAWRKKLNIPNPEPSLTHLMPWGCTAYVHIPKEKRVQSHKVAPRAWKGWLMGYEGDGGHIYKVWNPATSSLSVSRDVGFPQPGDDDDMPGCAMMKPVINPKGPSNSGGATVSSFIPFPSDEMPHTEINQQLVAPQRVQEPVTPSTIMIPTLQGSVSEIETPAAPIPRNQRAIDTAPIRGNIFKPMLRPIQEQASPTPNQRPAQHVVQQSPSTPPTRESPASFTIERRATFGERLRELTQRVREAATDMDEARQELNEIESNQQQQAESPIEPAHAEYQFPFDSSPIPQAPIQQVPPAVATPHEIISISSSPDPIQQPTAPPPRRSHRTNKGVPPERYHDPNEKLLAVEREAIKRTKETGGNNLMEGVGQGSAGPSGLGNTGSAAAATDTKHTEPMMIDGRPLHARDIDLPQTYKQAKKSKYWEYWEQAMQQQINDLLTQNAYSIVPKPRGKDANILPGQWRFTVKRTYEDFVYGFKARWVVCGNFQPKNDDDNSFYAPVVSEMMVKIVFTLIATYDLRWRQVDLTAAYLNASRKEEETIYMRQPTGFEYSENDHPKNHWVCALNQALYGLRDSAALWNNDLDKKLQSMGFQPLADDPCVYTRWGTDGGNPGLTIMMVYVDDFIIAAPSEAEIDDIIKQLNVDFLLKDLGEPKQFLACALNRDYLKKTITMTQSAYVQSILHKTGITGFKDLPLPAIWKWREPGHDAATVLDDDDFDVYQSVIGMLNWLAIKTRPDIRFVVTRLQCKMAAPDRTDLQAMQHVIKYLHKYPDRGITLGGSQSLRFVAHADASHGDWYDCKSTEGCVWFLAGCPITWHTRKQTVTADSTTVAEWVALDRPCKDAMWLAKIARELKLPEQGAIKIFTDSINSQLLLDKKGCRTSNRWLDIKFFFVKGAVGDGKVQISRVDTKSNAADGFTKTLPKDQFNSFVKSLQLDG